MLVTYRAVSLLAPVTRGRQLLLYKAGPRLTKSPHGCPPRDILELLEPRVLLSATTTEIANSLDLPDGVSASYSGDPQAVQARTRTSSASLLGFPSGRDEDFLILSSGVASQVDTLGNTSGSQGTDLGPQGAQGDTASISFTLPVPPSSSPQKLKFDFTFLSEEYPEYVGSSFDDFFTATVNGTNVALDQLGHVVSVNNVLFDGSLSTVGTFFDGRTPLLTASYSVPAGATSLNVVLSVGDRGDGIYDSAVLLDNVRFEERQLVWLDFEGQNNYSQGGQTWNVPVFQPTDLGYADNTNRASVISDLLSQVSGKFAGLDIDFVTSKPSSGTYMYVHVGGDDSPLNTTAGTLFGQATTVDVGNLHRNDGAVIFSREFGSYFAGEDAASVRDRMGVTIAHEVGHALGLRHLDNKYADDVMKKNAPLTGSMVFTNLLRDLPSTESWPDAARKQNDLLYLRSVLGAAGSGSSLTQSYSWLDEIINKWFSFSLADGKPIYNMSIGTYEGGEVTADGVLDADVAPQIVHFDVASSNAQLRLPNLTGSDKFFLVGSSRPGGPLDITSGPLDANGDVSITSAAVDWFDVTGSQLTAFSLFQKNADGTFSPFGTASLVPSEFSGGYFGSVSGMAWEDRDRDGVKGASEPPLPNQRVFADLNNDGAWAAGEPWAYTDAQGTYIMDALPPGHYLIRPEVLPGWGQTSPSGVVEVTVGSGAHLTGVSFGLTAAPPVAAIQGDTSGVRGQPRTFSLSADRIDGTTFHVNWGDGSPVQDVLPGDSLQLTHVFASTGTYTVHVSASGTSGVEGPMAQQAIQINVAELQADPSLPGKSLLAVGGSVGSDAIVLTPAGPGLQVLIDGVPYGRFTPDGSIWVYAQTGDDNVQLAGPIQLPAVLNGGLGDDRLFSGNGPSILLGGEGNDWLQGANGRDVLIGGPGADRLSGGPGDDIVIDGPTAYDADPIALIGISREWGRQDLAQSERVRHLLDGGGLNGSVRLDMGSVVNDTDPDILLGISSDDWLLIGANDQRRPGAK